MMSLVALMAFLFYHIKSIVLSLKRKLCSVSQHQASASGIPRPSPILLASTPSLPFAAELCGKCLATAQGAMSKDFYYFYREINNCFWICLVLQLWGSHYQLAALITRLFFLAFTS